ncbi:hypothetical protein QQF64_009572 [Cirrhinus molitorella]|uniref:Endonuclease/exonuclease/phosphatase domain-containing protein n=1 Tax=Cirrhinus molitorella TaxID=172907 RepID=A0ABR3M1J4_9TELE
MTPRSSQDLSYSKGQMEDSDNDYEDTELMENDGMDSEPASGDSRSFSVMLEVFYIYKETHTDLTNQTQWLSEWKGQAILSHGSSVSAGVAMLFGSEYKEQTVSVFELVPGRLLRVDITIRGNQFSFVNVYAPNIGADRVTFFNKLEAALSVVPQDRVVVVAGDFNCTLDHTVDRNHEEPHSHSADTLRSLIFYHSLVDIWRESLPQISQREAVIVRQLRDPPARPEEPLTTRRLGALSGFPPSASQSRHGQSLEIFSPGSELSDKPDLSSSPAIRSAPVYCNGD